MARALQRSARGLVTSVCCMGAMTSAAAAAFLTHKTPVPNVHLIGSKSWNGLGPWGYMVVQGKSAILIDVPYYSEKLADEVRQACPDGVSHVFLTHDDFVGMSDHEDWKK